MVVGRGDLTNVEWRRLEPHLPVRGRQPGDRGRRQPGRTAQELLTPAAVVTFLGWLIAVAHHEPSPALVPLVGQLGYICVDSVSRAAVSIRLAPARTISSISDDPL
ncbi:hypothetical protein ACFVXS_29740 [Streptomyces sviceus]|uniref:hypothetical protein n=1 Tax=Streptomyces sviceus TaxID=285530 RepID=UPI0036E29201